MNNDEIIRAIYEEVKEIKVMLCDHEERLDGIDARLDGMDARLDDMQIQIHTNGDGISRLENEVSKINLRLENEIAPNIMRVAEGHMDLYRKLGEATKVTNEQEMMAIRLNILEREMREVKDQTARLA